MTPATVPSRTSPRRQGDAGFTLTELIVAVGAVALLTVGIGQLFTSVQRLVGGGAAVAETDQLARALATQLQLDFQALSAMKPDETFIAIRNRRMGDVNRSESLDAGERALYLRREDKDTDQRDLIDAYTQGSRALSVRLDDMVFLAFAGGDRAFASAQVGGPGQGGTPTSQIARIYYGHGLRPVVDQSFDPLNPPPGARGNTPPRIWAPDGDFGARAGTDNRFDPNNEFNGGLATGRNEFAGEWLLVRQPLLLYGGLATGYPAPTNGAPFSTRLNYTPYIRDFEAGRRASSSLYWPFDVATSGTGWSIDGEATPRPINAVVPQPRLASLGRVDICAQNLEDVRRWLEGVAPEPGSGWSPPTLVPPDATAFSAGRVDADASQQWTPGAQVFGSVVADAPLWQRVRISGQPDQTRIDVRRGVMSAIAGCLARFQAEARPPLIDRGDTLDPAAGPGDDGVTLPANEDYREAAFMDNHAVIGSRISSIEIAWTDGKTWPYTTAGDSDGPSGPAEDDVRFGDLLWYDINLSRFDSGDPAVYSLSDMENGLGTQLTGSDTIVELATRPEVYPGLRRDPNLGLQVLDNSNNAPPYDPAITGADPSLEGDDEYLAIFPFRRPDTSGGYEGVYSKPTRIRVRVTLHDAQFRIPGGRRYEFILPIEFN
jgi:type II secretory pathway pseudopilin PulG